MLNQTFGTSLRNELNEAKQDKDMPKEASFKLPQKLMTRFHNQVSADFGKILSPLSAKKESVNPTLMTNEENHADKSL